MERNTMKKFLMAAVGLGAAGFGAPASAADMAVKAAPPPMVAPMIYSWTGFYIGANGGWGEGHNCGDFFNAAGVGFAQGCRDRSGGLIGGQLGYRWQANQFVFGLEAQGDWADLTNQRLSLLDPTFSTRTKTSGIGLFPGQIGYAWNASLFYLKGGAAVTDTRFSVLDTFSGVELAASSATAGAPRSVSAGSMASHPIGRSVSNTTTCSWVIPTIRSPLETRASWAS